MDESAFDTEDRLRQAWLSAEPVRDQSSLPPLGTKACDAATSKPVINRAGRITAGPPGDVCEANNSMSRTTQITAQIARHPGNQACAAKVCVLRKQIATD